MRLPFGKTGDGSCIGESRERLGNFGIVTLQSGRPFTVALLSEIDNSGTGRSILGFGANDRPNVVGNPELSNPTTDAVVQHRRLRLPGSGNVWKCGKEYSGWTGISERERVAGEEHAL